MKIVYHWFYIEKETIKMLKHYTILNDTSNVILIIVCLKFEVEKTYSTYIDNLTISLDINFRYSMHMYNKLIKALLFKL